MQRFNKEHLRYQRRTPSSVDSIQSKAPPTQFNDAAQCKTVNPLIVSSLGQHSPTSATYSSTQPLSQSYSPGGLPSSLSLLSFL